MNNKAILTLITSVILASCSLIPRTSEEESISKYSAPATILFLAQNSVENHTSSKVKKNNLLLKFNHFCGADKTIGQTDLLAIMQKEALESQIGLTPDKIGQATNMLASGQFISDINNLFDIAMRTIVNLATMNSPHKIPRRTLSDLLANDTFRFAIIIYAHAHGIDINENDLKFVKHTLDSEDINLTDLIDQGKDRLQQKYGVNKIAQITKGCSV